MNDRLSPIIVVIALLVAAPFSYATPPEYSSFHREQSTAPPDLLPESEWLEIWTVFIGQGDALLIRLPENLSYQLGGRTERIDILVDGGRSQALRSFLRQLYPSETRIEHVVLSHHDSDHVEGLTLLLDDDRFDIERIYHNGLASWARGQKGFPPAGQSPSTGRVFDAKRGLALVESDGITLQSDFFIDGLAELEQALDDDELAEGTYENFANAVTSKTTPSVINAFAHSVRDGNFISEAEGTRIGDDIDFDLLWPQEPQRRYRGWAYTINGNSLSFKLDYRDFSMLFPGDHNDDSEEDWLETLGNDTSELECDVLKIPHHGSHHNLEEFIDAVAPVLGVVSMGSRGFRQDWKHPSENVISWMGGAHKVYRTFIHERRFKYEHLTTDAERSAMIEPRHILIQTDGHWFRVVEVEDPNDIPAMQSVRRGNGTRWIRTTE